MQLVSLSVQMLKLTAMWCDTIYIPYMTNNLRDLLTDVAQPMMYSPQIYLYTSAHISIFPPSTFRLVCIATFNANSATTIPGKVLGLWPPIAAFVTIGLEHSVANFFFIPLGMALGANVSWTDFVVNNALPVTLGNFLAATLMALSYGTVYGRIFGELAKIK